MKRKKVEPYIYNKKGEIIEFNLHADAANEDWIRAARLKRKADEGDAEARKKLDELKNTGMENMGLSPVMDFDSFLARGHWTEVRKPPYFDLEKIF